MFKFPVGARTGTGALSTAVATEATVGLVGLAELIVR